MRSIGLKRLAQFCVGLTFTVIVSAYAGLVVAQDVRASDLKEHTHIHGLAVDRKDPSQLLVATHHGLYRVKVDGNAKLISVVQDFMGFTPDPSNSNGLFASGHPAGGGNLGFITSTDNGETWQQVSPGVGGPVDFHQMTVSLADPKIVYGAYGVLQMSRDAGKTWSEVGPLPDKLIDIAASAKDSKTLYAATESGLSVSKDEGRTWKAILDGAPVSFVEVTGDGTAYAFVVGRGFVRFREDQPKPETVSNDWGNRIPLHLAVDPANAKRMFVATHKSDILVSTDGGIKWTVLGG
jgi:photosystem II stability/assembly factor-like uncharacterized protein